MMEQNINIRSQVQSYSYSNHPIQKSIYLSKEGEQIPHPFSHQNNNHRSKHLDQLQQITSNNKDKRVTISQINTRKQDSSFWDFLSCCREDTTVRFQEYEDCGVCNRRVFKDGTTAQPTEEDTPYTSSYRMQSRQRQPVQVFYDKVKSHQLCGQRWRRD